MEREQKKNTIFVDRKHTRNDERQLFKAQPTEAHDTHNFTPNGTFCAIDEIETLLFTDGTTSSKRGIDEHFN
jgi:hypothetical protein